MMPNHQLLIRVRATVLTSRAKSRAVNWITESEEAMGRHDRYLKIMLVLFGIVFLLVYPLMIIWPSGWAWQPSQHEYEQMIIGVYATLGVFLIRAARNPSAHLSLIWFTVWSSLVHGVIMAWQALIDPMERGHLAGDVPALLLVAIVLAALAPRTIPIAASRA